MSRIPKQKIPRSRKTKEWGKNTIEAFIDRSSFSSQHKASLHKYYDAYNGNLVEADYNYVINPYNSEKHKVKGFPAKLRSYNIIKPVVDLLLGEKSKRPFAHQVVIRNSDMKDNQQKLLQQELKKYLEQKFINELNEMGMQTGEPSQEQMPLEELKEEILTNYKDARAIMGQEALDYMIDKLELPDHLQMGFFDWLVSGEVYSYKDICMNEVEYEIVSPLDLDYEKSPDIQFIEDGDWAIRRKLMSVNAIVDSFYDVLKPDEIDRLENPSGKTMNGILSPFNRDSRSMDTERFAEVLHVVWKSFARIGILTYYDEVGQEQQMIVDEKYKVDSDAQESVEYYWVNQVWEGYRIDGDIFVNIRPHQVQRNEMSNLSVCKLPYNGRIYSNRHSDQISIVSMGLPYQILYNIFHYRLELSIAKNKDKIMLMEMNTIPKRHGWDEEKFMYYADAMGYAFIDSTAEGKRGEAVTFNQFQVLDMSLGQYIAAQFQLLQSVKQEWEELIGISRQRKGQVQASDGIGATERAVFQSSVMTEELFRRFDKYVEREFNGLLDTSKVAWKDGKKTQYITGDYREAILDIDAELFQEAEYGVFVKNNSIENDKIQQLKQLTLSFAQNGSQPGTIAEILDSSNFAQIKEKLNEVDAAEKAIQQAQQQQAQQMQSQQLEAQAAAAQAAQDFEANQNQLDRDNKIEVKELEIAAKTVDQDMNNNGINDAVDLEKVRIEREKLSQKEREMQSKERLENKKLDLQKKALSKKQT